VIAYAVKAVIGLRPAADGEEQGLDAIDHGEAGYHLDEGGGHVQEPSMAAAAALPVPETVTKESNRPSDDHSAEGRVVSLRAPQPGAAPSA